MYLLYWYFQQNQCLNIKNMLYTSQHTYISMAPLWDHLNSTSFSEGHMTLNL